MLCIPRMHCTLCTWGWTILAANIIHMWTLPRTTKDVDININLVDEQDYARLKGLCNTHGHTLSDFREIFKAPRDVLPAFRDQCVQGCILEFCGLKMDIFFNTCTATQWAMEHARIVNYRNFLCPETLVWFKLFGMPSGPTHPRHHQDRHDIMQLLQLSGFRHDMVIHRLEEVIGSESRRKFEFEKLVHVYPNFTVMTLLSSRNHCCWCTICELRRWGTLKETQKR